LNTSDLNTGDLATKTAKGFVGYLVLENLLNESAGKRLLTAYEATGHAFDTIVIELGLLREEVLARHLAHYINADFEEQPLAAADRALAQKIGFSFLSANTILPLKSEKADKPVYVVANPFDDQAIRMIAYLGGQSLVLALSTRSAIAAALTSLNLEMATPDKAFVELNDEVSEGDLARLRDFAEQAPIVRLVTRLAQTAADERATDIHIEPFEHELRIRIRVDGVLKIVETVPASYLPGIATRLKIMANLDISERRLPQDGRIRIAVRGQEIDMRMSVVPSIHGETIVMRLLDRSTVALDLAALGFEHDARQLLDRISHLPNGIMLITGPTGSGKTTTLYALMSILNDAGVKIFTVEDPVEYQMNGITQLQTNNATGMTFARALRSVLRQDPDIILVGEIRDRETAEIAMQAALTGHLVLSTLHTNSAVGAITRLRDMGIEDYLIGATVKGILGQRLVRKSCNCQEKASNLACSNCGGSGFSGRTVTYEIVNLRDTISSLISGSANEETILKRLRADGMTTIEEHADSLVKNGITTMAEVARSVHFDDRELL
jgi:general secretion pathway protein E